MDTKGPSAVAVTSHPSRPVLTPARPVLHYPSYPPLLSLLVAHQRRLKNTLSPLAVKPRTFARLIPRYVASGRYTLNHSRPRACTCLLACTLFVLPLSWSLSLFLYPSVPLELSSSSLTSRTIKGIRVKRIANARAHSLHGGGNVLISERALRAALRGGVQIYSVALTARERQRETERGREEYSTCSRVTRERGRWETKRLHEREEERERERGGAQGADISAGRAAGWSEVRGRRGRNERQNMLRHELPRELRGISFIITWGPSIHA